MLRRVFEIRFALPALLDFVAAQRPLQQRGAEVLLHLGANARIGNGERLAKECRRGFQIAQGVIGRPFVELQFGEAGTALEPFFVCLPGLLIAALAVEFLAIGGGGPRRMRARQGNRQRQRQRAVPAPPFVEEKRGGEQGDPEAQRPLVTLDGTAGKPRIGLPLLQFSEPCLHQMAHVRRAVLQAGVKTAGGFGQRGERLLIQARFHKLPVGPFHKFHPPVFPRHGNERAAGGTDADGENPDLPGRFARRFEDAGAQVLAVGEEDQRPLVALPLAKGLQRHADRFGKVGAAQRDDAGIEFVEGSEDGALIDGQRRLQKGGPGKGDDAHAVALQGVEEILRGEFGPVQPVGRDVVGEHGTGDVHGEQDIAPLSLRLLEREAVAGLGQRGGKAGQGSEDQRKPQAALEEADAACQGRLKPGGDERPKQLAPAAFPPRKKRGHQRQERQGPEPLRRAPSQGFSVHGSLLQTVCPSTVCTSSRSAPAPRNHGKRSWYWRYCFASKVDFSSLSICS